MDIWVLALSGLTTLAGFITAITVVLKPFRHQLDELIAKELEREKKEQRMKDLEGWTGNQQSDIEDFNKGLIIMAGAVDALLDHAIEKQNGNGKCHKAQEEVSQYLREKALNKKSHS